MIQNTQKNCIYYCRVSAAKSAQEGESLDTQERIGRRFIASRGYNIVPDGRVFRETFTGRKDERPVLDEVFEFIRKNPGMVDLFVFRGIDRFTRGGSFSYEKIKKELARLGVEMVDTLGVIQKASNTLEHVGFEYDWSKTSPSEIAEIVIATSAKSEITGILTRMIGREIELTQQGYKVRAPLDGFINKRILVDTKKKVIQFPDIERSKYIVEIFKLRATGVLSDAKIVEQVNAMGYRTPVHNRWNASHERIVGKTGGEPLTAKRLQELIRRPNYCGIICEKWTRWQPIKAKYDGLVDVETFNRANRGKVFIEMKGDNVKILYDHFPEKRLATRNRDNPMFPYKNVVLCSLCKKTFLGSSPKGRSGQRFPTYHCARKHKYFGVPKGEFETTLENYLRRLRFRPNALETMEATLLNKYYERKNEIVQASINVHRHIAELKAEQKAKTDAFVAATGPTLRSTLERQIEALETQIKSANKESSDLDISEADIGRFKEYGKYFIEHLPDLLLNGQNPRQQRSMFALVFDEFPTYAELVNGTPKLTWIFELFLESATTDSILVRLHGLSWNTIERTILEWKELFHHFESSDAPVSLVC